MCIENMTLSLYACIIGLFIYIGYTNRAYPTPDSYTISNIIPPSIPPPIFDPYYPPVRSNGYSIPSISTQETGNREYMQIGFLSRSSGTETMLPLMGRLIIRRRDKWNYYCISDTNNSIKLPVSVGGKSCTSEQGCQDLNNGDTVYVEGYNDAFYVTMYDNDSYNYNMYL
jgi:hypothetical protein